MSNTERIEELRSKYEENPRRYFAPLANEFRKAGDLAQAIAICREHLPKQPGHMSGFIVLGQTLYEANSLDEARVVFEQALALDPENLIALKHLGDIARTKGENAVARRWYERVLDADPRNDDIASQLASLSTPTPPLAVAAVPDAVVRADAPPLEDALGVFATFDPSSLLELKANDAHDAAAADWAPMAAESPRPVHHEPIDLDFPDDPEPVAAESAEEFEEGLLAPEWPDTSELVARIVTPLRSATPVSSDATPEAVAAFGREAHEAIAEAREEIFPGDNLVDAFLSPAEIPPPSAENVAAPELDLADVESPDLSQADSITAAHEVAQGVEDVSREQMAAAKPVEYDDAITEEFPVVRAEQLLDIEEPQTVHELEMVAEEAAVGEESAPHAGAETVEFGTVSDFPADEAAEVAVDTAAGGMAEPATDTDRATESVFTETTDEVPAGVENEPGSFELPVLIEQTAAVTAADEVGEPEVAEESFAAISSELQEERAEAQAPATNEDDSLYDQEALENFPEPSAVVAREPMPGFVTETMAELFVAQGFNDRAIEIYEELVHRNGDNTTLTGRLNELRAQSPTERERGTTPGYNKPIRNTPQYVTPQYVTPHYSTPQSSSFIPTAPPAAPYPYASPGSSSDPIPAARTARDRFAELARRRVPRRTPTHATAIADDPADGLSSLFGTAQPASPDELAARALADAFGPVQDTGESLFDLSSNSSAAVPLRALTPRHVTPVPAPVAPPAEKRAGIAPDYSFDRFFPDPAVAATAAQAASSFTSPADSGSTPSANEDLAQFSAWLKGLNNP